MPTVSDPLAKVPVPGGHQGIEALFSAHDWASTPLGPRNLWPQSLTTLVDMMLASGHAMCLAWGAAQTLLYNDAYAAFMDTRHPGAFGKPFPDAWPEVWNEIGPLMERTLVGDTQTFNNYHLVLNRHGRAEDTWWDFSSSPVRDEAGRIAGTLTVAFEATSHVRVQRERDGALADMRANDERLRALVLASSDVLYTMSADWTEMRQLAGRGFIADTNAPSIKWIDEYLLPEDQAGILEVINRAIADKDVFEHEHRVRRADGSVGWTFSRGIPVLDDAGEIVEWFGMAADVSARNEAVADLRKLNETLEQRVEERSRELMAAEDRVRHMQKMEAIGQLTGGVAHDFNNLLTIIRSSAELLGRHQLPPDRQRKYIDAIASTADRAARLTGQLLAFARRQALRPEIFDAAARVTDVADMLRTVVGSRIDLDVTLACSPCFVEVDASQFETALINLAVNARDAMDGEGRLVVHVDHATDIPPLRGHDGARGSFALISVIDTGSGIAPEQMEHIFEPFFTTKEVGKGTGLGLSQVYGFTKQSGGEIDVVSEIGAGTTFKIYLPRVEGADSAAFDTHVDVGPTVPAVATSILIVEDNEQVGEFASQLLNDLGYATRYAPNAGEAMKILEQDHGAIDILFSDVVMPGLDGVELARRVRAQWPGITIVLTSGYSHVLAQDAHHGFELLHKPYSIEELSRVLRKACAA